jgi:hypothetical protein
MSSFGELGPSEWDKRPKDEFGFFADLPWQPSENNPQTPSPFDLFGGKMPWLASLVESEDPLQKDTYEAFATAEEVIGEFRLRYGDLLNEAELGTLVADLKAAHLLYPNIDYEQQLASSLVVVLLNATKEELIALKRGIRQSLEEKQ